MSGDDPQVSALPAGLSPLRCCLLFSLKTFAGQRPLLPVAMGTAAGGDRWGGCRIGETPIERLRAGKRAGSRGKCEFEDVLAHMTHNRSLWKEQNSFAPLAGTHTICSVMSETFPPCKEKIEVICV